jgi:hypothetical protein
LGQRQDGVAARGVHPATALSLEQPGNYDAFVMGRVTYEKFSANWGHITGNPYINLVNAMPAMRVSRVIW